MYKQWVLTTVHSESNGDLRSMAQPWPRGESFSAAVFGSKPLELGAGAG